MALESIINPYEEHVIIDPHYLKDRVVIARNYNQYKKEVVLPDTVILVSKDRLKKLN